MIVGGYEVARYCPHQNYDLKHHSSVDLKNKTITCLGHGWTWDLKSGNGVNTKCSLKCKEVKV
jgi:nitrite reductase/ring-hydroxylating ferredoxin subunit